MYVIHVNVHTLDDEVIPDGVTLSENTMHGCDENIHRTLYSVLESFEDNAV